MIRMMVLTSLSLLVACSDANYESDLQAKRTNKKTDQPTNAAQKGSKNGETAGPAVCCDVPSLNPGEGTTDSEEPGVMPPVPVVGSFLAAVIVDANGNALPNAEVIVEEIGVPQPLEALRTDAAGHIKVPVANPQNIRSITVLRRTGTSTIQNALTLSSDDLVRTRRATYSLNSQTTVPPRILEITAGANGSQLAVADIANPVTDTRPPTLTYRESPASGGLIVVTITAADQESGLHAQAYSFTGGTSWSSTNSITVASGTVFSAGQIQVRDKAGNISRINANVSVD